MSVINYFFSEISGAEPLKELAAANATAELPQTARDQLLSLRADLAAKIKSQALADRINETLAGLFGPDEIRIDIETLDLSSREGVERSPLPWRKPPQRSARSG